MHGDLCMVLKSGGGGTQILIDWGCAIGGSKPIPISRGNFLQKLVTISREFSENRHPFLRILTEKTQHFQVKNETHVWDFL